MSYLCSASYFRGTVGSSSPASCYGGAAAALQYSATTLGEETEGSTKCSVQPGAVCSGDLISVCMCLCITSMVVLFATSDEQLVTIVCACVCVCVCMCVCVCVCVFVCVCVCVSVCVHVSVVHLLQLAREAYDKRVDIQSEVFSDRINVPVSVLGLMRGE